VESLEGGALTTAKGTLLSQHFRREGGAEGGTRSKRVCGGSRKVSWESLLIPRKNRAIGGLA